MREAVKTITETRTFKRVVLSCTHLYSRPVPMDKPIKKYYVCHACKNQKEREELGFKPQKGRRKNKS